ncbi:DUF1996 domain-containing protein [Streptomyces griseiscabiei]|uniref:DUF1996 domain-containing protein n=1 Tax=Streptomyces griseiscabiei TaxID=2993540 RepID=A0ABU4L0Y9_9ACTN|nr:DUF1996 domain-containing protein [Streptomyces griseiscabiei]MDX2909409.1 DUF1996 domain-containing protein [Streptomyces griseiscabiei]
MAVNVYASATEEGPSDDTVEQVASAAGTIDCPDVGAELTEVPEGARPEVDKELAALDQQIAEAYQRLQNSAQAQQQDGGFADNAIMNPLKEKRAATIERIAIAIDRVGDRPDGLDSLAACELRPAENQNGDGDGQGGEGQNGDGQNGGDQNGGGQDNDGDGQDQGGQGGQGGQGDQQGQPGNGGQAGNGPVAADYADIKSVQPNARDRGGRQNGSTGSFTTACGVNANGLFNSDNVIVAPGVSNGAHHFHDYVGNQGNSAFASDEDLAAADTSCENQGDRSSYFWPVIRLQNGTAEQDANSPGGGIEGNAGEIVTPKAVTMSFEGSPRGDVTEMPRLLRIITGDAKAFVNGPANANASWSCTGFEDRQLKDKYPLCPAGSDVVRTFEFQSCWDGRNIDSANHRTHVAFAAADGGCAAGFKAIPQLVQRIVYDVDAPSLQDGGRTTPLFAVDSFPEQLHKPVTDHGDFINVFDEDLMRAMVDCINDGRECDAADIGGDQGDGGDQNNGGDQGDDNGQEGDNGQGGDQDPGQDQPGNGQGQDDGQDQDPGQDQDQPGNDQDQDNGQGQNQDDDDGAAEPSETAQAPGAGDDQADQGGDKQPQVLGSAKSTQRGNAAGAENGDQGADDAGDGGDEAAAPAQTTPPAANFPSPAGQNGSQGSQSATGSLAETGSQMWPAMIGGVAVLAGVVLLRRVRRGGY